MNVSGTAHPKNANNKNPDRTPSKDYGNVGLAGPPAAESSPTKPKGGGGCGTLTWKNVSMHVTPKRGSKVNVLSNAFGEVAPRKLTCIMGHSGSGKTSLLNVLCGRMPSSCTVQGDIRINGIKVDPSSSGMVKRHIAFVPQRDALLPTVTPREAIRFSARLRLPTSVSDKEIAGLTDNIIAKLGLQAVRDSVVGGEHLRGLSGGEMRRVSLGVELVSSPSILILDEVTSGLDSHNAAVVMEFCKSITASGETSVLMTIHQPNSYIFSLVDSIVLMRQGLCMYSGDTLDMPQVFAKRGYPLEPGYNWPDFVLRVSHTQSQEDLKEAGFFFDWSAQEKSRSITTFKHPTEKTFGKRVSMVTEVCELLYRDVVNLKRDYPSLVARLGTIIGGGLLVAICFLGVGLDSFESPALFASHASASFLLTFGAMVVLQLVLTDCVSQRVVFAREYSTDHFRMLSFTVKSLVMEASVTLVYTALLVALTYYSLGLSGRLWYWFLVLFVFAMVSTALGHLLASIPDNPSRAFEFIVFALGPQLLLCGALVYVEALPIWIQWTSWIMPLTYAFRLLLNEEFSACLDYSPKEQLVVNCIEATENAGLGSMRDDGTDSISGALYSPGRNPFSLLWEMCAVEKTQFLSVNNVGNNFCDMTVSAVLQGEMNENLIGQETTNPFVKFVAGRRLLFSYPDDLSSISLNADIPFQSNDTTSGITSVANSTLLAHHSCDILETSCHDVYQNNTFESKKECITRMDALPTLIVNDKGQATADGNSTSCRFVYANLATHNPESHCAHVSYFPMEDPNGKTKCSESSNYEPNDFFSKKDMALFALTAGSSGLDETKMFQKNIPKDDRGRCDSSATMGTGTLIGGSNSLPSTYACSRYLRSQNATGSNNIMYWTVLVGMWILVRVVAFCLLKMKVGPLFGHPSSSNHSASNDNKSDPTAIADTAELSSTSIQLPTVTADASDQFGQRYEF